MEISWLRDELNQRKCGRQTMPSPQGQSVGLTRDCRAMPLSSGSSDTYIWKHLLSFKEKNITQRPVLSSSFQNYFSDLIQRVWAPPTLQGYGKTRDHSQPKGIAAHYFTSFQTQHCGFEYPEEKMQQAPPAVVFSHLTANLLREREEQSL